MRWQRLEARIEKAGIQATTVGTKSAIDVETLFLYNCITACKCEVNKTIAIQHNSLLNRKQIDWKAVGTTLRLKPGTASMRWRRLKEKIEGQDGASDTTAQPTSAPAAPASTMAKAPVKRKKDEVELGVEEEEDDHKKVKLEPEEATVTTKRQPRCKVLNLKDPLDTDSETGNSRVAATGSSAYEPSSLASGYGDNDIDSVAAREGAGVKPTTLTSGKLEAITTPKSVEKVTKAKDSASQKLNRLESGPGQEAAQAKQASAPKPLSPTLPCPVEAIKSHHEQAKTDLAGLRSGMVVSSQQSEEEVSQFEPAADDLTVASSDSTQDTSNKLAARQFSIDTASLAPEDSISMAEKVNTTGLAPPKQEAAVKGGASMMSRNLFA